VPWGIPLVIGVANADAGTCESRNRGLLSARPLEQPSLEATVFGNSPALGGDAAGHILTVNVGAVAATRHSQLPARCEQARLAFGSTESAEAPRTRKGHPARSDHYQFLASRERGPHLPPAFNRMRPQIDSPSTNSSRVPAISMTSPRASSAPSLPTGSPLTAGGEIPSRGWSLK
jgi:hypothetical protein